MYNNNGKYIHFVTIMRPLGGVHFYQKWPECKDAFCIQLCLCIWQPDELHEVMYEAILNNKPNFVRLFVANGVDLGEFLTINRLLQLYNNVSGALIQCSGFCIYGAAIEWMKPFKEQAMVKWVLNNGVVMK